MGVAKVFDVFGEIAEEEDIGFANLARDLNLFERESHFIKCYKEGDSVVRG